MMEHPLCLLASVVIIAVLLRRGWCQDASVTADCEFYYLGQPPRELPCDPYHELSGVMRIECTAGGPIGTSFAIQWYRSPGINGQLVQQLTSRTSRVRVTRRTARTFLTSRITDMRLDGNTREYWCQVAMENENNQTVLLEESSRTILRPEEAYSNLPPCPPTTFLADFRPRCATDKPMEVMPTECQPPPMEVPLSPSVSVTQNGSLTESVNATVGDSRDGVLSPWSYGVIALGAGGVVIAGVVVVVIAVCLYWRRRNRKHRKGVNGHIHVHATHPNVSVTSTSPTAPPPRRPRMPPSRHPRLPPHLMVTRQPSNDSQYTSIQVNTTSQEGRGYANHGSGTQANGTRPEGEEPVAMNTREGTIPSATPGREDSNLGTSAQPLARSTAKASTTRSLPPPTVVTSALRNTSQAVASPNHGSQPPRANRSPLVAKLEGRHVYHGLDPSKRDESSTYTAPLRSLPKAESGCNGLRVPTRPKPQHLQINTLADSGDYCNEAPTSIPQRYQALSPQTRDYVSLYSTAEIEQDVQSPT